MLKTSILFWAVKFRCTIYTLKEICDWTNTLIECPLFLNHHMTPIHMAAQEGYDDALSTLLDKSQKKMAKLRENEAFLNNIRPKTKFSFNIEFNEAFSIKKEEISKYDPKFIRKIKIFAKWKYKYEREIIDTNEGKKRKIFYDEADLYGNSPLHLASMLGREACVKILISLGCDIDKPNREGFRPRELTQNPKIKKIYVEDYSDLRLSGNNNPNGDNEKKRKIELFNSMSNIFLRLKPVIGKRRCCFKRKAMNLRNTVSTSSAEASININSIDNVFKNFSIYIPEFVIRFRKKPIKKQWKFNNFSDRMNIKDDANADRINFYVSLLINAHFEVYLAPSIDNDYYFVMLSLSESQLYKQCHNLKMRLKLIDSYNYQVFELSKEANFEPFRSRQRQEIIFHKVNSILDLNMLKSEGLVQSYFMMHSASGISEVRKRWITSPKWFWPQPLNQIDDYLIEGKSQNFNSVTSLKQYLGEKISFYFAWRSFITCFSLPLAIPGFIIQIYIVMNNEYHSEILIFWVFFVSLWTTIMVEFWKRKCSEINTRWGALDLMNDENWTKKNFRREFSGDECVSSISQQITKYTPTDITIYVFLASLPILLVLLGLCGGTYYLSQEYKEFFKDSEYSSLHSFLAGLVNGIVITLLNFLYTYIARWFVKKENHKFQKEFENSLIMKSFAFRFLNSYLAVFWTAFIQKNSDFQDLFDLLWPILIYKQASNIGVQVNCFYCNFYIYSIKIRWCFLGLNINTIKGNISNY